MKLLGIANKNLTETGNFTYWNDQKGNAIEFELDCDKTRLRVHVTYGNGFTSQIPVKNTNGIFVWDYPEVIEARIKNKLKTQKFNNLYDGLKEFY